MSEQMTGVCSYCGQTKIADNPSEKERNYTVTKNCDCSEGQGFRKEERIKDKIEKANHQINILFGQDQQNQHTEPVQNQRFIELMQELAEAAIRDLIRKASIEDEDSGTKGTISVNTKKEVKIERGDTFKQSRTV